MRIPVRLAALFWSLGLPAVADGGAIAGRIQAAGDSDRPWVVYVEEGPPAATPPARSATKEMVQKNQEFQPSVLLADQGGLVEFLNVDNVYHNVFSPTPGHSFDMGLYRGGAKKAARMKGPGEVDVYCNIHPQMRAKILVLPPQHVVAAVDGTYLLAGLAPGHYRIVAWGPALRPARKEVEVRAGQSAQLDFSLEPRGSPRSHLNKEGEQYGRYK